MEEQASISLASIKDEDPIFADYGEMYFDPNGGYKVKKSSSDIDWITPLKGVNE